MALLYFSILSPDLALPVAFLAFWGGGVFFVSPVLVSPYSYLAAGAHLPECATLFCSFLLHPRASQILADLRRFRSMLLVYFFVSRYLIACIFPECLHDSFCRVYGQVAILLDCISFPGSGGPVLHSYLRNQVTPLFSLAQ